MLYPNLIDSTSTFGTNIGGLLVLFFHWLINDDEGKETTCVLCCPPNQPA